MKTISIEQATNGYTVTIYSKGADAHPVDFFRQTMVFQNSSEVVDFVKQNLVEVSEGTEA